MTLWLKVEGRGCDFFAGGILGPSAGCIDQDESESNVEV